MADAKGLAEGSGPVPVGLPWACVYVHCTGSPGALHREWRSSSKQEAWFVFVRTVELYISTQPPCVGLAAPGQLRPAPGPRGGGGGGAFCEVADTGPNDARILPSPRGKGPQPGMWHLRTGTWPFTRPKVGLWVCAVGAQATANACGSCAKGPCIATAPFKAGFLCKKNHIPSDFGHVSNSSPCAVAAAGLTQ